MKKLLAIILCLAALLSLSACGETKTYKAGGFSVQLPRTFERTEKERYALHLNDGDVFVWTVKDDFSAEEGMEAWPLNEYVTTLYLLNELQNPEPVKEENGIIYFEYSAVNEKKNKTFTYLTTAYKASDAFYMVQFVCEDKEYETYKPLFMEWAKTVKVK